MILFHDFSDILILATVNVVLPVRPGMGNILV